MILKKVNTRKWGDILKDDNNEEIKNEEVEKK